MTSSFGTLTLAFRFCLVALASAAMLWRPTAARADTLAQETLAHVERLRAVTATSDDKAIARLNQQMDEAWKFFLANKAAASPVLREQLTAETRRQHPNSLVLLDIGYFLLREGNEQDNDLAKAALLALDASSPVVQQNQKELFEFTHRVAAQHDPRVLPFIDKAFLRSDVAIFVPQHALRLDDTLVCVFLYGVYGEGAESHLSALLSDRSVARKVVEVLTWLGSPASAAEVRAAYAASPDYETFARMTAFMMKVAGPQGRAAMLDLRASDLDARSRDYYAKVKPAVASTSYESLRKQFGPPPEAIKLSNEEVKARLAAMNAHYGRDETTHPLSVLNSGLRSDYLIAELVKIRARTFNRLSDEALSDVEMTNALLNALRYRGK